MSVSSVNGSTPVQSSPPAQTPTRAATPQDVRALQDAFAAAAKRGQLPVGEPKGRGAPLDKGLLDRVMVDKGADKFSARPAASDAAGLLRASAEAETLRRAGGEEMPEQPVMALMQQGPHVAAAAPAALPQAHVDPSVFADMLSQLWLREKDRSTREVRVTFGDSAWPATGARLTRLDDGSLSIAVSIGDRSGGGSLAGLRERLEDRGLLVADIGVDEG